MSTSEIEETEAVERRFPRRFLLTAGAAAAAVGAAEVLAPNADAVSAGTAWVAGGNSNITNNGSNFLGPKNKAPLIFKTAATAGHPAERMRIAPTGQVGIGRVAPAAALDVRSAAAQPAVRVASTSTNSAIAALLSSATKGAGVSASSTDGTGVIAKSTNGAGIQANGGPGSYGANCSAGYAAVYGSGGSYGGIFYGNNTGAYGTYSNGNYLGAYGSGGTYGLYGTGATGVYGSGTTGVNGHGSSTGVYGSALSGGKAVWGSGGQYGVYGNAGATAGVRGDGAYVGVWGQGTTYALYALSTDAAAESFGLFGECQASNANAFALYAKGRSHIAGTLSKSAGSFKIDHPLDPEHKWLSHSFVESPDMMNVYNGNVVLDQHGKAAVQLPDYFAVLNTEYRYQLTPIGAHAPVYVSREVADNAFEIAGGPAGLKVSWQVTGIRQDDYAKHHPIEVETPKSEHEVGLREFVPPGSRARAMRFGPVDRGPAVAAPEVASLVTPNVRRP